MNTGFAYRRSLEVKCQEYSQTLFARFIWKTSPAFHHIKSFAGAIEAVAQAQIFSTIAWSGLYAVIEFFSRVSTYRLFAGVITSTPQKRLKETKERMATFTKTFHHELKAVNLAATRRNQLQTNMMIGRGMQQLEVLSSLHLSGGGFQTPQERSHTPMALIESQISHAVESRGEVEQKGIKINMPFKNPDFMCRENILGEVHDRLWPIAATSVLTFCALQGMGGVGKTQTALQYVYQFGDHYNKIFWIHAEDGPEQTRDSGLIAPKDGDRVDNNTERARRWLETTVEKWLLVFDNVEQFEDIAALWPSSSRSHGSIIVTTRTDRLSLRIDSTIPVDPMDHKDGSRLLFHHLEQPETDSPDVLRHPRNCRWTSFDDHYYRELHATNPL
ncbi:hypothetical protein DL98DRAFT_524474 [Cadophora sp. DSE1049]|nr:hypothetical protein DL98DRAFT_524474 [Cadophora sp. DSE1049]